MSAAETAAARLSEHSPLYPGWRVALAASGCVFVSFGSLGVYTFGIFVKPIAAEFGWSRQAISSAFALSALSFGACSPVIGRLLDRYPARRIILPCFTIFGLAFASLSLLTPHLWQFYAIFILNGMIGSGTAHLAYTRAVATWFHNRRGAAFASLMAGSAVGAIVFPPLATALVGTAGWRNSCVALGAMALVIGLSLGRLVRESPSAALSENRVEPGLPAGEALRSRIFWIIITVHFCSVISQNAVIAHLSALLTDRGISPAGAALAVSTMGGSLLAGRLATGWLLDRHFAPRVCIILLAISSSGVVLLSGARSLALGAAGAALMGLGVGGEVDVMPYLLSKYFNLRSFSTLYGFSWTAATIAGAAGPVIMGRAFDVAGSYQAALLKLAAVTALGALLLFFLPRYESNP